MQDDEQDESAAGAPPDSEVSSWSLMLRRGVLDPKLHSIAGGQFRETDFTLLVLRSHLIIEKALNHHLEVAGVPTVLLGSAGLEFHQKVKAYQQLRGFSTTKPNMFTVLNTLRNNIAHDFWDEHVCVRDAFARFLVKKQYRVVLDETAATPIDSVKLLFLLLAQSLGVITPDMNAATIGESGA